METYKNHEITKQGNLWSVWINNTIYYRDSLEEIKGLVDKASPSFLEKLLGDK
jgi:hypothetical protein